MHNTLSPYISNGCCLQFTEKCFEYESFVQPGTLLAASKVKQEVVDLVEESEVRDVNLQEDGEENENSLIELSQVELQQEVCSRLCVTMLKVSNEFILFSMN